MLIDCIRKELPFNPYVNTGTMFDFGTGKFLPGTNGGYILDGGLPACLGISGRGQTYKSGVAGSFLARALINHPDSNAFVYESEGTVSGAERYNDFVSLGQSVSDRIMFMNSSIGSLSDFYDNFKTLADTKIKNKKDYLIESPFLNPKTGKAHKIWLPTFVLVDSFSRAMSDVGDEKFDKNDVDDSSMNTMWMAEGNVKTRIMHDLPIRAAKAGIYVIMTAHVGAKMDMDPYNKTPKQLQYMKNSDKMKNVGSNFEFLTTTLIQTLKAVTLQDKEKHCLYPTKKSTDVEVNQVDTMLVRCKNNAAGINFPFVVSQYQGILDTVTNFQFLKTNKNFGMNVKGNNESFAPILMPDTYLNRKTIRTATDSDYALTRALELLAQLCFIQRLWSSWNLPDFVSMRPEVFAEKLTKSTSLTVDRVLQSTGVWSSGKQDRERLTIMDILSILDSEKI